MKSVAAWKVAFLGKDFSLEAVQFKPSPETINAASQHLPEGVYTTFRTYTNKKAFLLASHFERLEKSAYLLGRSIDLQQTTLRQALRQAIEEYSSEDVRVRLTVDLELHPGDVYIVLEPLKLPTLSDYQNGVKVVTCRQKREKPEAKQTSFISVSESLRLKFPPNAFEGLLVDHDDCIREGFTSNFYAVKDGDIKTPGEGILSGLSRRILLEAAELEKIGLSFGCIHLSDLGTIDEAFLTSSTRAILPINQVDHVIIGGGKPGPITRKLSEIYSKLLLEKLEPI
jgi:branched-chain amino acid aminotransferase